MSGISIHIAHTEPPPSPQGLAPYLNVGPGIDVLHATYKARGVEVLEEVVQQPWACASLPSATAMAMSCASARRASARAPHDRTV
jgi:hypothetical protein